MIAQQLKTQKALWYLFLIFFILIIGVIAGGYLYYAGEKTHIERDEGRELSAIANLKVVEISNWRKERMEEARAISENPFIGPHVEEWLKNGAGSRSEAEIVSWMTSLRKLLDYDRILLLDKQAAMRLAIPDRAQYIAAVARTPALKAIHTRQAVFSDLVRDEASGRIHIDLFVPLLVRPDSDPVGVLVLEIDPHEYLYPLVQTWPTPSRTAETLLIRREGNDIIFLNKLRHQKGSALSLRLPLSDERLPAAMAALGVQGVVKGIDYRGVPVLAALQAVPDSPWFVVAKIDMAEVYAPMRERGWVVITVSTVFIIAAGISIILFWRHQRLQFAFKQSQAELEAETALAQLRHQNELILTSAGDGIFGLDLNGNHTFVNPAAAEMLGYKAKELVGRHSHSICHYLKADGSPYPEQECPIYAAYRDGSIHRVVEEFFWRRNGTGFPVEYTSTPIIENGNLAGAVVTFKDITERKEVEEALQESEQRYRSLFQNNHAVMLLIDPETGNVVDANPAACTFYGYLWKDLTALKITDINTLPPEQVFQEMQRAREESRRHFHFRHRLANGDLREVEVFSGPITLHGREFLYSIVHDITERKQAEEKLRASEERYRNLYESARDIICTIDLDGIIYSLNPVFEPITGWSRTEWVGKPFSSMLHPEDSDPARIVLESAFRGERPPVQEWRVLSKSGEYLPEEFTVTPQFRNETVIGVMSVGRDISERKQIEEERLRAGKLESIGILAGGIAHDFNNILTALLGNITLARLNSKRGEKVYDLLLEAEKASFEAKGLTQQLLTFARGGAPVKKVTPVVNLIKEAAVFAARGSNTQCRFSIPDDLWPAEVDEGQIRQVISNLVLNAVQAMPEGGVVVIQAENTVVQPGDLLSLKPGEYVRVSVQDHGIGILKEHLSRVFDPYFTTKQKGSGLGLTICYSIIRDHGGYIGVNSEIGVGTTVYFYLPAMQREAEAVHTPQEDIRPGRARILVMDDEKIVRDIAKQMLNHIGYEVDLARDGFEAIDLYSKAVKVGRPFDAVILDLTVPGSMGGREATQKLLEIDPAARIIVSSGYSNDPIMAHFREYGFRGVVAKPYHLGDLAETLHRIIEEGPEISS